MSTETAQSADLRRLKSDQEWYGYLTLENFDAVAERIRSLLTDRAYTWASCREHQVSAPEVRTRQRLREGIVINRATLDDGRNMAHLTAGDTYGVWGIDTTIPDQKTAYAYARDERKARRLTEVKFKHGHYDGGRIEIEQYNGYGERLYWVISVERDDDETSPGPPAGKYDSTIREALRIAVTAAENDRQAERFEAALAAMGREG